MSDYAGFSGLVDEIKQATSRIELGDQRTHRRMSTIEESINDLYRKAGRPGGSMLDSDILERKASMSASR